MEDLKGYQIQKEAVFENGRGFALAHNPEAQSPSVIWHFTVMPEGERNYYGYTACRGILPPEKEFERFLSSYDYVYKVPQLPEGKRPRGTDYYRYYTRYPLDANAFPKSKELGLLEIAPYDNRTMVEGNSIRTWGELIYTKPLPEKLVADYELKPSRLNPDVRRKMEEQTQALGKWEDSRHFGDKRRLTWFHPDFGTYILKQPLSPEQLSERIEAMEELEAERKEKRSSTAQLRKEAKQEKENREPSAKKGGHSHEDR